MNLLKSLKQLVESKQDITPETIPGFADWNLNPRIHPLELSSGKAGRVTDSKGREFVDYLSGWGSNILGHNYPRVAKAVKDQADRFFSLGLENPISKELASILRQVIPCAEGIKFGKNGSDSTLGAVRLARAVTGRKHVLYRGYHGFHDWYMAGQGCKGLISELSQFITPIHDLDLEKSKKAFEDRKDQVACLIIDPGVPPVLDTSSIQALIEMAHAYGALVVFDEIGTGFRVAPGGMHELVGVMPDLATYGKAMANGMPLSALVGKAEYMIHIDSVNVGKTFELESISMAAAIATIQEIQENNVCQRLRQIGRSLKNEYKRLAHEFNVITELIGPDPRPQLQFQDQAGISEKELRWLCIQELVSNGILTLGTFLPCYSHSDKDLIDTVNAMKNALRVVAKAVSNGSARPYLDNATFNSITQL